MDESAHEPIGADVDDLVRVTFDLSPDDEGWPPVSREGLWALQVAPDVVRLRNTPWFARGVANGDVIRVRTDDSGTLLAGEQLEWSGICTVRVIPFDDGPLQGPQGVLDTFASLGVTGEGLEQFGIVSLEVPPGANLVEVQRLLRQGETGGWWTYEEGCVGDAWMAADPAPDEE